MAIPEDGEFPEAPNYAAGELLRVLAMALDDLERAHAGEPRTGEEYYAHRDAIRSCLAHFGGIKGIA